MTGEQIMEIRINPHPEKLFITGFIGSNRLDAGKKIADSLGFKLLFLDDLIVEKDGRPLKKIIMMMGEHEYRNKEYEVLEEYEKQKGFVMVCGDGVVLDDMCLDVLKRNPTLFVDELIDLLWARAKDDDSLLYAFLQDENKDRAFGKFCEFYKIRLPLYQQCGNIKII
jgi:shikimate kinase